MAKALLNFVLFQASWFAAVLGGAHGWPWTGSLVAVLAVSVHIVMFEGNRKREVQLVAFIVLLGLVVESLFQQSGVIVYHSPEPIAAFPPVWILAMWLAFATLPNGVLGWLHGRLWLAAVFGAVSGPLTYQAGAALGAAQVSENMLGALVFIGLVWALAFPLILRMAAISKQ
jgi:hypothetical protein